MEFELRKGWGNIVCNMLRHAAYGCQYVLRPIAFRIGTQSSILSGTSLVIEDMLEFTTSIAELQYLPSSDKKDVNKPFVCHYRINSVLKVNDLNTHDLKIIGGEPDKSILHLVPNSDSACDLFIYFRYDKGYFTKDENTEFLYENKEYLGISDKDFNYLVPISSRHCNVTDFRFRVRPDLYYDNVELIIKNAYGDDETQILNSAKKELIEVIRNVGTNKV